MVAGSRPRGLRYFAWHHLFRLSCWIGTHGPRRRNGDRWSLPAGKRLMRWSHPLWLEEWE